MKEGNVVRYDGELWQVAERRLQTALLTRRDRHGNEQAVRVEKSKLRPSDKGMQSQFYFEPREQSEALQSKTEPATESIKFVVDSPVGSGRTRLVARQCEERSQAQRGEASSDNQPNRQ